MNIETFRGQASLLPLVELQGMYDRTFSRINEYIDRDEGHLIPQMFVSGRGRVQLTWERDREEVDRLVNFTMFKKIILGLESIHAKTDTPLVGVYRMPLRFYVEEWYEAELYMPGRGRVLPVDNTGLEVGADSLFNNGSHVNSSVVDS